MSEQLGSFDGAEFDKIIEDAFSVPSTDDGESSQPEEDDTAGPDEVPDIM